MSDGVGGEAYGYDRLGRFSSPDPLAGSTSNPQSLNRFAYVLNDTTSLVDPVGLDIATPCMLDDRLGLCSTYPVGTGGGGNGGGGSGPGQAGSGGTRPRPQPLLDEPPDIGHGPGGGTAPLLRPLPQPPPPPISAACLKALKTAGVGAKQAGSVLGVVTAQWSILEAAATYEGVDASILASVAIRETGHWGLASIPQQGGPGHGHGEFQLDENTWGNPIPSWAYNPQFAAVAAAWCR